MDTARRRRAGFLAVAKAAGLPPVIDAVGPYSRSGGYEACLTLLKASRGRPASSHPTCWSASARLPRRARRGVRVPEDLSIVTLDAEDANYTAPPLTAIAMPLDEMGTLAVEELHAMIEGREPKDVVVDVCADLIVAAIQLRRRRGDKGRPGRPTRDLSAESQPGRALDRRHRATAGGGCQVRRDHGIAADASRANAR